MSMMASLMKANAGTAIGTVRGGGMLSRGLGGRPPPFGGRLPLVLSQAPRVSGVPDSNDDGQVKRPTLG